jgi:hypothetical protein
MADRKIRVFKVTGPSPNLLRSFDPPSRGGFNSLQVELKGSYRRRGLQRLVRGGTFASVKFDRARDSG